MSFRPCDLILTVLAEADGHLTADAVHERAAAAGAMDLPTVYRTPPLFKRLQIVHTMAIGKRVTYGPADHPHRHTVCDGCARVTALHEGEFGSARAALARGCAVVLGRPVCRRP